MTEDDLHLWQRVAKTVKPLRKASMPVVDPKPKTVRKKKTEPVSVRNTATKTVEKTSIKPTPQPLPEKQVKKLRQHKIGIEGRLDLHGYILQDAHEVLLAFMRQASARGWRCVEVITGRGNAERGTGQLRRLVPMWLETMHDIPILHIEPNPASRGGSLLIMLRRRKG